MILEYFDALRDAGLYEDATIIITGDHARAMTDKQDVADSRVTALFVKESGDAGSALAYSSAPVCQENLRAQIVKSAGLETEEDYGLAFSDIAEDAELARKYCFEKTLEDGTHQIVEYRVTGDANDFSNWELVDRRDIGKLYK
jgi:arylsulfatase A-like enzyme